VLPPYAGYGINFRLTLKCLAGQTGFYCSKGVARLMANERSEEGEDRDLRPSRAFVQM